MMWHTIFLPSAMFLGVLGLYSQVIKKRFRLTPEHRGYGVALYFGLATSLVYVVYQPLLRPFLTAPLLLLFLVLSGGMLVSCGLYYVVRQRIPPPLTAISQHPDQFFLRLSYPYLIIKTFEIVFQQACIAVLVSALTIYIPLTSIVILVFAVAFGVLHLPLIFTGIGKWSWYFIICACVFGALFPILLLHYRLAFYFNVLVHLFFYVGSGCGAWIYLHRSAQRTTKRRPRA